MIKAEFKQNDNHYAFSIEGHANYAEHGKDIVCSSVSVLSITVANEISEIIPGKSIVCTKDGLLSCRFNLSYDCQNYFEFHIDRMYQMLKENIQDIERQYPDYVKVVLNE